MEMIPATQEASAVGWGDTSDPPASQFLLFSTPSGPFQGLAPSQDGGLCFNSSQNCTRGGSLPGLAGIFIPLIYGMVCVVGLLGNTLVIHVVVNYTKKESVTNIYILNLAIADELFMLGLPFLAAQNALLSWPFGSLMCRVVMTVDAINQFTSIFCLTVMSVDRYLAVVHPIRSARWRRPRVAKAVSATVWAGSFVVVLPVVVFADVLKDHGDCSIVWPEPAEVWKASFIVYTCTVGFSCPLLVICLCYLLIVIKVRSVGKRAQATSSRRRRSERKITRMVVVVVAVFVLCWLPFYALNIVNLMAVLPGDFRGLYFFVVVLSYANSCANPILYGFLSDNFKRGFRKALCRASRRVKSNDGAGTEAQRPTEEWGGIALQTLKSEAAGCQNGGAGGMTETHGSQQMSEICQTTEDGTTDGSRTLDPDQANLGGGPEPESAAVGPPEVGSSLARRLKNGGSLPQEFLGNNSVLEISYL